MEVGGSEVQGYFHCHSELKPSLGHTRPFLKLKTNGVGEGKQIRIVE